MNIPLLKFKAKVKNVLSTSVPYTPLLEDGNSSPYFGTFEGQRTGYFDTNCCWDFSGAEVIETRLEMLMALGKIPKEHIDWLKENRYLDETGDFYISRRWIAILSGVRDGGNYQQDFWNLASVAGVIPNWMLPFDATNAAKWLTKDEFNNEYFDVGLITEEMENMGKEFLKRFSIFGETLSGGFIVDIAPQLEHLLKEGSVQIGHPVPQDGSWNEPLVKWPQGRMVADHATECYWLQMTSSYPLFDYDSYQPHLKQLSKDYYIPFITRVVILPKAVEVKPIPIVVKPPIEIPKPPVQPSSSWLEKILNFIQKYGNKIFKWGNSGRSGR